MTLAKSVTAVDSGPMRGKGMTLAACPRCGGDVQMLGDAGRCVGCGTPWNRCDAGDCTGIATVFALSSSGGTETLTVRCGAHIAMPAGVGGS